MKTCSTCHEWITFLDRNDGRCTSSNFPEPVKMTNGTDGFDCDFYIPVQELIDRKAETESNDREALLMQGYKSGIADTRKSFIESDAVLEVFPTDNLLAELSKRPDALEKVRGWLAGKGWGTAEAELNPCFPDECRPRCKFLTLRHKCILNFQKENEYMNPDPIKCPAMLKLAAEKENAK